eukprot:COSAG01_NODE_5826_length_4008_cov_67.599898_3_plen_100_part_00
MIHHLLTIRMLCLITAVYVICAPVAPVMLVMCVCVCVCVCVCPILLGTVEAAAFLTRAFKSVRGVELLGFSGLMLTCLEDTGMAAAAAAGHYDIRALLQ